jgi:hypothetical protein
MLNSTIGKTNEHRSVQAIGKTNQRAQFMISLVAAIIAPQVTPRTRPEYHPGTPAKLDPAKRKEIYLNLPSTLGKVKSAMAQDW